MWKHVLANVLTLALLALLGAFGAVLYAQRSFYGPGPLTEPICFRVEPGARLAAVSERLREKGAITNPTLFRVGARYTDRADRLRFGAYVIPPGASMDAILDLLTEGRGQSCGSEVVLRIGVTRADYVVRTLDLETGRFVERLTHPLTEPDLPEDFRTALAEPDARFRVTLAEGVTSWQVWDALQKAEFLSGALAEVPAEGWLAPETYEVRRGAERSALVAEMRARQEAILAAAWERRRAALPLASPEEALILASIIEKETGLAHERRTIAGVLVNRLRRGMPLQTDPTVIYGLTEGRGTLGRGLRRSELERPTPWNTYVITGLPPTPIANPGRASIEAAVDPEETPYLYFVADGSGGHLFATTLAEHNRNVARWRQIEAERAQQDQNQNQ